MWLSRTCLPPTNLMTMVDKWHQDENKKSQHQWKNLNLGYVFVYFTNTIAAFKFFDPSTNRNGSSLKAIKLMPNGVEVLPLWILSSQDPHSKLGAVGFPPTENVVWSACLGLVRLEHHAQVHDSNVQFLASKGQPPCGSSKSPHTIFDYLSNDTIYL